MSRHHHRSSSRDKRGDSCEKTTVVCGPPGPRGCPGRPGLDALIGAAVNLGVPFTFPANSGGFTSLFSLTFLAKASVGWLVSTTLYYNIPADANITGPVGFFTVRLLANSILLQSYTQSVAVYTTSAVSGILDWTWYDATQTGPSSITYSVQISFTYSTSGGPVTVTLNGGTLAAIPVTLLPTSS
jgi:hypothetical protein